MTEEVTVVITGIGGGVGQSILKGLNLSMDRGGDIRYRTVGVDADPQAAGLYRTDAGYVVPRADDPNYVDRLCEVAREADADVLLPGSDPEVLAVARNRERLADEGDLTVLVSPPESVETGLDKWKTYQFLSANGFNTPETALATDADRLADETGFPLVVKPRTGSASRGLHIVTDEDELASVLDRTTQEMIVQEYLVPDSWGNDLSRDDLQRQVDEYSTEVIVDADGEVVNSLANWRKMDKGVPSVAKVKPYDDVRQACEAVAEHLDVVGPVNLQARITDSEISIFELNTRFTGSTAVRCVAGFNGPHAMVRHLVSGERLSPDDLSFEDLVEIRYKNEVYLSPKTYEQTTQSGQVADSGRIYDYM